MTTAVIVHKARTNTLPVYLGYDVTGETFTSQVRTQAERDSSLIFAWTVAVTDAATGLLTLTADDSITDVPENSGYMDLKRVTGGQPLAVFDRPLEVEIRDTVTE